MIRVACVGITVMDRIYYVDHSRLADKPGRRTAPPGA